MAFSYLSMMFYRQMTFLYPLGAQKMMELSTSEVLCQDWMWKSWLLTSRMKWCSPFQFSLAVAASSGTGTVLTSPSPSILQAPGNKELILAIRPTLMLLVGLRQLVKIVLKRRFLLPMKVSLINFVSCINCTSTTLTQI